MPLEEPLPIRTTANNCDLTQDDVAKETLIQRQ